MVEWYVIEIVVNFLQFFVIFKVFDLYYKRRFYFTFSVELTIIFMTVVLSLLNYLYTIYSNPLIYISFYILIIVVVGVLFKDNILSKVGLLLLLMVFLGICEFLASILVSVAAGMEIKMLKYQNYARLDAMVISQTLFLYSYLFMKKKISKEKFYVLSNKYYMLLALILFFTLIVMVIIIWMYGNVNSTNDGINSGFVLLTLCVSFISIISIALIDLIIKDIDKKHKSELELHHIKMEQLYCNDVNSALEEIRILRHDMRGELAIIHGYNELNQKDNIRKHIEKKLQEIDIQLIHHIDNDNILTSFLNFKVKEAKEKNINIHIENQILDNDIHVDKEDICRILNNIINNAIEATIECDEKHIELSFGIYGKYIIIKSVNSFNGQVITEKNKIITKKQDKKIHGYGLKSIKSIAEKYNGFVDINYMNNEFNISVQMENINNTVQSTNSTE